MINESEATIQREDQIHEVYAFPGSKDENWSTGAVNAFVLNGAAAKPNLISLDVNPLISKRRVYAYLWARALLDPAANFCMMLAQISFSYKKRPVKRVPLSFTLGTMPSQNVLARSLFAGPLAGGLADPASKSVTLYNPNTTAAFNTESTIPLILQPLPVDFACDNIALDVLGWANFAPTNSRFILYIENL